MNISNHTIENEIIFFVELFFGCNAHCSGCNIPKTKETEIKYTEEELITINSKILEYTKELSIRDNKQYKSSITLGPADFLSLDINYIISVLDKFDKDIVLVVAGNLLDTDYKESIKQLKKYCDNKGQELIFQIVFNPIVNKKNQVILKQNIQHLKSIVGKFDNVINMSKSIYNKYTPKQFLDYILEFDVSYLALVSSPNDLLIRTKEFQTSLVEETLWLEQLFQLWFDSKKYGHIDLEVFENRALFFNDFDLNNNDKNYIFQTVYEHHKKILYIDKQLNLRMSCENIGDYHYIDESNFLPLGSIKFNSIYDLIFNNTEYKRTIVKQISGIYKNCGDCKFKIFCMTTPVFWQQEKYPDFKGQETIEYCYGLKKINQKILDTLDKK